MVIIEIQKVIKIENGKLFYRGDNEDIAFINLKSCAERYEKEHNILDGKKRLYRCVGERFFGEYDAYYEFYTEEHTRLHMRLKTNQVKRFLFKIFNLNFHVKEFRLFYRIQEQLNARGWTTIDLT